MKRLDFFKLPRITQDRFIASTIGQAFPEPILIAQAGRRFPYPWAAGSAVALLVFVVLLAWGYGSLDNSLAINPIGMVAAYAILVGLALWCVLMAVAKSSESSALPFIRAKYLFPSGLVDATEYVFQQSPIGELVSAEVVGQTSVVVRFADGAFARFQTRSAADANAARAAIAEAQQKVLDAQASGDPNSIAQLDPLVETGVSSPFAPTSPLKIPVPGWRKFAPLIALGVGVAIGFVGWLVRNSWSERRLLAAAQERNTPESYQAYLARGGERKQVREILLPRAELARAKDSGTKALERYAKENRISLIRAEIDRDLREALLAELQKAKQAKSITALDQFARAHPDKRLVAPELADARYAVLQGVIDKYAERAKAGDPALIRFMGELMNYVAKHGSEVQVRFRRVRHPSLERADVSAKRHRYFKPPMLPSQYFEGDRAQAREKKIFSRLKAQVAKLFPADVLALKHGPPLEGKAKIPEQPKVPTLFISHRTGMSGAIPNLNPSGTFFAARLRFETEFVLSGGKDRPNFRYSTWRPPELLKLRKGKLTIPQVYETMADEMFAAYEEKLAKWIAGTP